MSLADACFGAAGCSLPREECLHMQVMGLPLCSQLRCMIPGCRIFIEQPFIILQVADAASAVFGGAAFDLLHLNARQVSSVMLGVALLPTVVWTLYAWWQCKRLAADARKASEAVTTAA